ncbi:MAG: hemerythrin domain-containing protein [Gemmatimonadaceae bacterium]|nr:hemerythrin domain-containing protein [Chitinophagaceae bacterium]
MQRYNVFGQIHKGLRAFMYDTALSLQQTWFADSSAGGAALAKVDSVLAHFDAHAHHEDHFILPAIARFEKALVEEFEKEHVTDLELSNRLRSLLNIYYHCVSGEEKKEIGSAICKSFVEFMVFNLEHMAKEEILLNRTLWKHYTDDEIMEIQQRLVATIPPQEMAEGAKWMFRGINNSEAIHWLKGVKEEAPEFVFQSLLDIAEREMPAERWNLIMDAVCEGAITV